MNKLQYMIDSVENHIKWLTEDIEKITKSIKELTATATPEYIAEWMPGRVAELQEKINKRKEYGEQLSMLKFLEKEED